MATYKNLIGMYVEPAERPTWTGEIVNLKTGELVKEPSMTKQSFKEECDINNIVKKFEATGQIDHVNQAAAQGYYDDLPSGLDLQIGLNMIAQAEAAFMALPAHVRAEYDNDPVMFVDAFKNPSEAQQETFIRLGLAKDMRQPQGPPAASPASQETPDAPIATPKAT